MGDFTATVPTILPNSKPSGDNWLTMTAELFALSDAWSTWTPTLTNLTVGSTLITARYRRVGKTVDFRFKFKFSSGAVVGTAPAFTLPAAPHSSYTVTEDLLGDVELYDNATAHRRGHLKLTAASTVEVSYYDVDCALAQVNATTPQTWASGDSISAWGTYETA